MRTYEPHTESSFTANARTLRKHMTPEERHLWYDFLKDLPVTVNRQKILGRYIADFYCHKAKLVIELDGSQHYDPEEAEKDRIRTEYLKSQGLHVLRFTNLEITREFNAVCEAIHIACGEPERKS